MGISNENGHTSMSNNILQKEKHTDRRGEIAEAIMKVMTKIFSAKVVLEKLPEKYSHKNSITEKEILESDKLNYDSIPEQVVNHEDSDEEIDVCGFENKTVEVDIMECNEPICSPMPVRTIKRQKGVDVSHMFTKVCPKCSDKFKGNLSTKSCSNCKQDFTFKCKKCEKEVKTYGGILYHLSTKCNFQGDYYQCPDCDFQSVFRYTVEYHVKKLHSNEHISSILKINNEDYRNSLKKITYKCSKCDKRFRSQSHLLTHCRLYCNILETAFDKSNVISSPDRKQNSISTEIPGRLLAKKMSVRYCLTCDKNNNFEDSLEKCSNCNEALLFKCLKCNTKCKDISCMARHLRTKCASRKNYKCSECKYTNPIQLMVLYHYKNVHKPVNVVCSLCGSTLKNQRTLNMHKKYCKKIKKLFCGIGKCSFKTHNQASLASHKKRHLQKYNTDCPNCGKVFNNRVTMKTHLFTCGKPPRFQCNNCPYKSKHKRDLQTHMLRRHLREINNDYESCPKCGVVFKNKWYHKGHLRLCGTSKPHLRCNFCYYMTHCRYNLIHHLKTIHSDIV